MQSFQHWQTLSFTYPMILLLSGNLMKLLKTSYTWLNIHVLAEFCTPPFLSVTGILNLPATHQNLHAAESPETRATTLGGPGHAQLQDQLPRKRDHHWEGLTTLCWLWHSLITPAGNSHYKSYHGQEKSCCQKRDKNPALKSSLTTYETDVDREPWAAEANKLPLPN